MASFFFDKNRWRLVGYRGRGFDVRATMTPARFNRPGNNRAQIRAEDRTSGRGQCTPGSDGGARILRRPARRWQCAPKANAGSIAHRM